MLAMRVSCLSPRPLATPIERTSISTRVGGGNRGRADVGVLARVDHQQQVAEPAFAGAARSEMPIRVAPMSRATRARRSEPAGPGGGRRQNTSKTWSQPGRGRRRRAPAHPDLSKAHATLCAQTRHLQRFGSKLCIAQNHLAGRCGGEHSAPQQNTTETFRCRPRTPSPFPRSSR